MMIEIHQPELEFLIRQQLAGGHFQDVENVLLKALQAMPSIEQQEPSKNLPLFLNKGPLRGSSLELEQSNRTGAHLIQAMQASPHKEIDIEPTRPHLPVRDVTL